APDVDAQLERVRADDARDLAVAEPGLDLAPVEREVAGAVAAHAPRRVEARRKVLAQVAEHHLHLQAAAAEDDGLHAIANPRRGDAPGFEHRAAADAELAADEWRVVEDEASLSAWRSAAIDEREVILLEESLRELARVADRRRRADERRGRAVERARALQAADGVGRLAGEKPAIGVQLVDDDEVEAGEQAAPARVVRQQDGKVVAERLAAGGGRNHDQVMAVSYRRIGLGLVRVESLDAAAPQRGGELGAEVGRKWGENGG